MTRYRSIDRVLVIGIDGGTWKVLNNLSNQEEIPGITKICKNGICGSLLSTYPPVTPAAWGTFQTGVGPEHHGILDFLSKEKRHLVHSGSLRVKTIWEYLSQIGKKVVCINLPLTYPPYPVNGYLISGMLTPSVESKFTYPPSLKRKLLEAIPDYRPIDNMQIMEKFNPQLKTTEFINELISHVNYRRRAAELLIEPQDWDLFLVHFQTPDLLQHLLWNFIDPSYPLYDSKKNIEVRKFYRALDKAITSILSKLDNNVLVILMSDHGFRAHLKTFWINNWLFRKGYLREVRKSVWDSVKETLFGKLRSLDHLQIRCRIGRKFKLQRSARAQIDIKKSICYGWAGGFQPYGFIHLIKQRWRWKIIRDLKSMVDPETGEKIVKYVWDAGKVFSSNGIVDIQGLAFEVQEGYSLSSVLARAPSTRHMTLSDVNVGDPQMGTHDIQGIYMINGPNLSKNNPPQLQIADIPATILYALDVPVPDYMTGTPITSIFTEEFRSRHQIKRIKLNPFRKRYMKITEKWK